MLMTDSALSTGLAFVVGELEKANPTINEPLTSVTWPRDIVAETGGGWIEYSSSLFVDYTTAGANQFGIITNSTNVIATSQANLTKDIYPVQIFGEVVRVPFVDQQKLMNAGRSLDQLLEDGLRLNYNKSLDQNVYLGYPNVGQTGLVNNPNVTDSLVAVGASTHYDWARKTPQEILNDVNTLINSVWATSQYDVDGIPNQLLIPPANFAYIVSNIVSTAGNITIMEFLLRNNLARAEGVDFQIFPCRQCIGIGLPLTTGGAATQRMVAYRNDMKRVSFDIPVPLTRVMTQPDVQQMSYLSAYLGQVGVVKLKYLQTIQYADGI